MWQTDLQIGINKDDLETDSNWFVLRLAGKVPERRGYHSSFIFQDK